ncbi:MAG: type II toxin-antitoxin system VapC family toxin [Thermoplasmatota archaeon]
MTVLDTSFLIALERGDDRARHCLQKIEGSPMRVPAIAWIEFLGVKKGVARQRATARLSAGATLAPLDAQVAERAIDLQAALLEAGKRLGWNDVQIAATALQLGEPLATFDDAFAGVPGLTVVDG